MTVDATRYVAMAVRTMVDPSDPSDLEAVHALQDAIVVSQDQPGAFETPTWDAVRKRRCAKPRSSCPPHCRTPEGCSAPSRPPTQYTD